MLSSVSKEVSLRPRTTLTKRVDKLLDERIEAAQKMRKCVQTDTKEELGDETSHPKPFLRVKVESTTNLPSCAGKRV
jgi:hypothetical protein